MEDSDPIPVPVHWEAAINLFRHSLDNHSPSAAFLSPVEDPIIDPVS